MRKKPCLFGNYDKVKARLKSKDLQSQIITIWRAPRPCGASPTQPYKCGQYFKINVNLFISALAKTAFVLILTLILTF